MQVNNRRSFWRAVAAIVASLALAASGLALASPATAAPKGKITLKMTVKQTGVDKVRTKVAVTFKIRKTYDTRFVDATLYPQGSVAVGGPDQWQRILVKWSSAKKAYVGKGTWVSKRPGKVTARAIAKDARNKTVKPKLIKTTITGWKASAAPAAGESVTNTVTVKPTYGRQVILEYNNGSSWVQQRTYSTASKAWPNATWTMLTRFSAPGASVSATETSTYYLPDMVEALNEWAIANNLIQPGQRQFRAMHTDLWGGPSMSTSSRAKTASRTY